MINFFQEIKLNTNIKRFNNKEKLFLFNHDKTSSSGMFFLCFFVVVEAIDKKHPCGQTPIPPDVNSNVIGGTVAKPYSWPWQIAYFIVQSSNEYFDCGGSIIGSRWVMTAGHCAARQKPEEILIKSGIFDHRME